MLSILLPKGDVVMKVIMKNGEIIESSFDEELGRNALRHTAAHILAQAVKRLYPETKCAIGPAIDNGFYYDFEFGFDFSIENLAEIKAEMKGIIKEALPIEHYTLSREDAIREMNEHHESYKLQLLADIAEDSEISFFRQGDYAEMCAVPHVRNINVVKYDESSGNRGNQRSSPIN